MMGTPLAHDSTATGHCTAAPTANGRLDWPLHRSIRRRALWSACAGGAALIAVYLGVLAVANSLEHALTEFLRLWFWMTPIIVGFAAQIGLFAYARGASGAHAGHGRGVAASGGASTVSMVACCAHHLTDVLPLVGLAGAAFFLSAYQSLFLLLGALSNLVGLVYLLGILHRHRLFPAQRSLLALIVARPVDRALLPTAIGAAALFAVVSLAMMR